MNLKDNLYWRTLKGTAKKFISDNSFRHSAAIAYFTIFSLPGIVIISVSIASSFYERAVVRNELISQITLVMGHSIAQQVEELMIQASVSGDSWIMSIVGIATLVISATTVFISLQESLNVIWKIRPKPKRAVIAFLLKRLLSLAMIASVGFLILVSLIADVLVAILQPFVENNFSGLSYFFVTAINGTISVLIMTFIFALIFKVLPDAQIKWKHVRLGAIVTTLLFVSGKFIIGYYLGKSNLAETYGAAGSLVALLAWVYYSVLILIFGAQFTFVHNKLLGHVIKPNDDAVVVEFTEVAFENKSTTTAKEIIHEKGE